MRQLIFLTGVLFMLAACGGSGGGSDSNSAQSTGKSLFSKWTTDSGEFVDFTDSTFNVPQKMYWVTKSGSMCSSKMLFTGNNSSGQWTVSDAVVYAGSDPGCSQLNATGTYTNDGVTLTVCRTSSTSCGTYH